MAETDAIPDMERELRFFPIDGVPRTLAREQIDHFNENGFIFPVDVFDAGAVKRNRDYFNHLVTMAHESGMDSFGVSGWHRSCEGLYDLVRTEKVLDFVEDIVGPNIICKATHYFSKEPGDMKSVYWHQDAQFWSLTPSKVVTVWLAIDDVDEENGAMNLFPGTHRMGVIPFEWVTEDESGVLNQHVHDPERFAAPVSVNLKAGQISLHSDLILHGSMPNPSSRRRCGLTMRYFPPDVRTRAEIEPLAIICRGSDPHGYWQDISRPVGDNIPVS